MGSLSLKHMESKLEILTNSAEQTQTIGLHIGENAQEGDIFLLSGELGTGKTCLTQGIAAGLGVTAVSYTHLTLPTKA